MPDRQAHEYANRYPMLSKDELNALASDIKKRGLLEPIVIFEDKILDGRNRYAACNIAGVTNIKMIKFSGTQEDAINFVISKNYHRRHLTESQRAMEAARILKEQKNETIDKVAKKMKVSSANVKKANKVLKDSPEKADQVSKGEKTVAQAHKEVDNKTSRELALRKCNSAISALNNIDKEFRKEIFEMVRKWIDENIDGNLTLNN